MVSADKEQEKGNSLTPLSTVSLACYITHGSVVKELDIVHNQSEFGKDYIVFKWSNQRVGVSSKKQRTEN